MSTEGKVGVVLRGQLIQDIGGMRENQRETPGLRRRNTSKIGAVEGRIVESHDRQFSCSQRNEGHLVNEEGYFPAIAFGSELIDGHPAVMVVIAESDINRCKTSQFREEPKEVRESVTNIEEVAGDEDPIGSEFGDAANDGLVSWKITVQMQVTQMHGAAAGQRSVNEREMGDSGNR